MDINYLWTVVMPLAIGFIIIIGTMIYYWVWRHKPKKPLPPRELPPEVQAELDKIKTIQEEAVKKEVN